MRIVVAGAGYVGLSLAILFSRKHQVICVDPKKDVVRKINSRISPIQDEYIERYLKEEALDLQAVNNGEEAYSKAEIVVVAVNADYEEGSGQFDLSHIDEVVEMIDRLNKDALIVIKSTVPVGYTKALRDRLDNHNIVFSPEFLRESTALYDNLYPSRIVVGSPLDGSEVDEKARMFADILRDCSLDKDVPVLVCGLSEAETIKLFSNTYLALRVAYFNELDTFASARGLDSKSIIEGVGLDKRIGSHYNNPSFGYGGYCLPKDTKQLRHSFGSVPENLISAIVDSNKTRKDYIVSVIEERAMSLKKRDVVIGIYGLGMKSGSDNYRGSSVLDIMDGLSKKCYSLLIYEPTLDRSTYEGHEVIDSLEAFISRSDIIVANRYDKSLDKAKGKVITRDIFNRD